MNCMQPQFNITSEVNFAHYVAASSFRRATMFELIGNGIVKEPF